MKPSSGILLIFPALFALLGPGRALAAGPDDGGTDADALAEAAVPDDGSAPSAGDASDDGGTSPGDFLACDGALCSTSTGGTTCGVAGGVGRGGGALPVSAALLLGAAGVGIRRRGRAREQSR
jgi:hypothetical protein